MTSSYKNIKIYENYYDNYLNCKFLHFTNIDFVRNFSLMMQNK